MIFKLRQVKHKLFRRDGNNLHVSLTISLREALLGFKKELIHLDGHPVVIERKGITKPDAVIAVLGVRLSAIYSTLTLS